MKSHYALYPLNSTVISSAIPKFRSPGKIGRQAQTHARADMTSLKKNLLLQNKLVFYAPWRSKFAKIRKKHNGVYDLKWTKEWMRLSATNRYSSRSMISALLGEKGFMFWKNAYKIRARSHFRTLRSAQWSFITTKKASIIVASDSSHSIAVSKSTTTWWKSLLFVVVLQISRFSKCRIVK